MSLLNNKMEPPHETTYAHKNGAGSGADDVVVSADVVTKDEHDTYTTAQPSEIEEDRMALTVADTGTGMRILEPEKEIEEEEEEIEMVPCEESDSRPQPYTELPSGGNGDDVYVAVGKSDSSFDALSWALKNAVKPGSFVYLIHVFPEVQQIPTPLGNMPKNQLSKDQVENYMNQVREKRRQMLQKYLNLCHTSKVEYDVHLIESAQIENAILELISVMHIKILVIGTSKSNLRRLKRGGTKAGIIQKKAPQYCQVKIICEGKDISTITAAPYPTPPASPLDSENTRTETREPAPESPLPPEIPSTSINQNTNPRKENMFKKLFRFFSCNNGILWKG